MGFFRRNYSRTSNNSSQALSTLDKAFELFAGEQIECTSLADQETIEMLYKALKEQNYDTADDPNLVSAISSLDANLYHLCKALIFQNFMLMRKVNNLSNQISNLSYK